MAEGAIEAEDTVRFIGRRARWTVLDVDGDTIELIGIWGDRRRGGERTIVRPARRDQLELVRTGNAIDDAVRKFLAARPEPERPAVDSAEAAAQRVARQAAQQAAQEARARRQAEHEAEQARRQQEEAERAAALEVDPVEEARYQALVDAHGGDVVAALIADLWSRTGGQQ